MVSFLSFFLLHFLFLALRVVCNGFFFIFFSPAFSFIGPSMVSFFVFLVLHFLFSGPHSQSPACCSSPKELSANPHAPLFWVGFAFPVCLLFRFANALCSPFIGHGFAFAVCLFSFFLQLFCFTFCCLLPFLLFFVNKKKIVFTANLFLPFLFVSPIQYLPPTPPPTLQ